jgi:hypothetical protein
MVFAERDLDDSITSASLLSRRMSGMTELNTFTRDLVSQLKTASVPDLTGRLSMFFMQRVKLLLPDQAFLDVVPVRF